MPLTSAGHNSLVFIASDYRADSPALLLGVLPIPMDDPLLELEVGLSL